MPPEHIHQSVDERELQHIPRVCTDILLRQPESDLSALPGADLCTDWICYLCACEYILYTKKCSYKLAAWTRWINVK